MRRLIFAVLSAVMLTGCAAGEKGTSSSVASMPDAAVVTAEGGKSSSQSQIIYRERLYNINSYTKSDLIIESDGKVWCGFYMHNEGSIDRFNRLRTSAEEYQNFYELDDDRWLASALTESKDDDFMLFGDMFDFEPLSGDELARLNGLVEGADICSTQNAKKASEDEPEPDVIEEEYDFIDLVKRDDIYRVYEYTQSFERTVEDNKANEAIELVHGCGFYSEWRAKCREYWCLSADKIYK